MKKTNIMKVVEKAMKTFVWDGTDKSFDSISKNRAELLNVVLTDMGDFLIDESKQVSAEDNFTEKSLFRVGQFISIHQGEQRKILAESYGVFLLSEIGGFRRAANWYTEFELIDHGYKIDKEIKDQLRAGHPTL